MFDIEKLAKAGKAYDIDVKIQTTLDCEGREGREGREDPHSKSDANTDSKIIEPKEQNDKISNEDGINKRISQELKGKDGSRLVIGSSQASQASQEIYRIGNTDQFGCNYCKLKGDKYFMQVHQCNGPRNNKSKLAKMVESNLAGNGDVWK